jgi:hypothetical protein
MTRRKAFAAPVRAEDLQIPPQPHPFFVVMKKVGNAWRGCVVGAEKLLFFVFPRKSKYQVRSARRNTVPHGLNACR